MKLVFVLLGVLLAVHAAPLQPLDKWSDILVKVHSIRNLVLSGVDAIGRTAQGDNKPVGDQIVAALEERRAQAVPIFEEFEAEIESQTLTLDGAEAKLDRLKAILAEAQSAIAELLSQLSQSAQDRIKGIFAQTYSEAEKLANEIRALLATRQVQPLDKWSDIRVKVHSIRNLVLSGVDAIGRTAQGDNKPVGDQIVAALEERRAEAVPIFQEFETEITAETLTLERAEQKLDRLKLILANAQQQIAELVSQLTQASQERIKTIFDSTYSQAEGLANQIRELLATQ